MTSKQPEACPAEVGFTLTDDVRTASMVWQRELLRYLRTPSRIVTGVVQAVLYLFVLGYGLSALLGTSSVVGTPSELTKFMFPGILAMSIVSTSTLSAISIVWDREFGFLREMLVAPVRRAWLVVGKLVGGASIATAQAAVLLLLAPAIGLGMPAWTAVALLGATALTALVMTSFGVLIASYMTKMEGFQVVMQLVLLPMIFLSGATFPLQGLPQWLLSLTKWNPLTYAVSALRETALAGSDGSKLLNRYPPAVDLFGQTLTVVQELGIVLALTAVFTGWAVLGFSRAR